MKRYFQIEFTASFIAYVNSRVESKFEKIQIHLFAKSFL